MQSFLHRTFGGNFTYLNIYLKCLMKNFFSMKKIYLTLFAMMVATAGVMAQGQVGIKAGFNVATTNDEYEVDGDEPWRPGFNIGLASQFRLGEVFSVAPELIYTQRGFKEEYTGGVVVREARFDYLSLPVLFRLQFGDVLKGYVNAGPVFSYWLGGKQSATGTIAGRQITAAYEESITFDDLDEDYAYDANRFEIGASVGGGIMLDTEGGSFLIDLRYTQGFGDIANGVNLSEGKFRNQVVGVSLIYLVPSVR